MERANTKSKQRLAPVLYLQKYRVERLLRSSSARLLVRTELCELPGGLPEYVGLNVGHSLRPAQPDLELHDDQLTVTLNFGGEPFGVVIPWAAVIRSESYNPPVPPGSPTAMAAV